MVFKSIVGATCTCLAVVSFNINAALIDNGTHTTDANTGLIWLDLTETVTDSYIDTYNATQSGGIYENYRVATRTELETLFSDYLFDISLWDLWGNSWSPITGVFFDDLGIDEIAIGTVYNGAIYNNGSNLMIAGNRSINESGQLISTALVKVSTVPVPAAVWLFGSGLIGLIGLARRKA